jgi:hypothetical protein
VIGAGSTGLAVLKALRKLDCAVECYDRGSDVGGNWRYENDSGLSSAYASLRANVSRERMQYPSFPMPSSYDDFPHHLVRTRKKRAANVRWLTPPCPRLGGRAARGSVRGSILSETQSHSEALKPLWRAESDPTGTGSSDLITRGSRVRITPPLQRQVGYRFAEDAA